MSSEKEFQRKLVTELKTIFPECLIVKPDPKDIQGIPDLLILCKDKWAALECKKTNRSAKRPNQNHYVDKLDKLSFSRFVTPDNKKEVLDELQQAFGHTGTTRISRRKQIPLD